MKTYFAYTKQIALGAAFALAALSPATEATAQVDGKSIFENNCKTCHAIGEKVVGPDLKDVHKRRDDAWIKSFIGNSSKMVADGDKQAVEVFEANNKIPMPSFAGSIDEAGMTALVDYIKAESEAPVAVEPEKPAVTDQPAPVTDKPFSLKDLPGEYLMLGLVLGFILFLIVLMMGILAAQLLPALAGAKDEKELENSRLMRWLALFSGDTRALTGRHRDVVMEGHDYDGIVEFDNDLPPWWKYMFYVTIFWGGAYLIYYHVTESGDLQTAEYHAEMEAAALIQSQNADDPNAKTDFKILTDAAALEEGKKIYAQNCAACHGQNGEGTVGPNLTDEFWLHGGDVNAVFKTVKFGVPAKGMVAWNKKLSKDQLLQVSSYILSIQGTKPANGKEPQGEKVAMK